MTRQTASGWRRNDQLFIDELRCRQNAMSRALRDQQLALTWKVMEIVIRELDQGNPKIAVEIGKSLGLFCPVPLPCGPETVEEMQEQRAAQCLLASQAAAENEKDRERRAHLQARAEAEQAYARELIEAMTPMDEEVYKQKRAELLARNTG